MIHKGIDGALVGLTRDPLRQSTLTKIAEIKAATGWVPVHVTKWKRCFVCGNPMCHSIYDHLYVDRNGKYQQTAACPFCGGQGRQLDEYRTVYYWSIWRPWTWGRPSLYECRSWKDVAELEVLPELAPGPEAGRLTLVRNEGADE